MTYLQTTKNLLKDLNTIGCTEEEIQELEKKLNVFLPESYKEFLLWMGKDSGGFLRGSDFLYPKIIDIQDWSWELIEEAYPEDERHEWYCFTFLMHQGYTFWCFSLLSPDNTDPIVCQYTEGEDPMSESLGIPFSQWLAEEAKLHLFLNDNLLEV